MVPGEARTLKGSKYRKSSGRQDVPGEGSVKALRQVLAGCVVGEVIVPTEYLSDVGWGGGLLDPGLW